MLKVCCVECASQILHVCRENLNWEAVKKPQFWCFMKKKKKMDFSIKLDKIGTFA